MEIKEIKKFAAKIRLETVKQVGKRGFRRTLHSLDLPVKVLNIKNNLRSVAKESPG